MLFNRKELLAITGMARPKFDGLAFNDILPFSLYAQSNDEPTRHRRYKIDHLIALYALDELLKSATLNGKTAAKIVSNSLRSAIREAVEQRRTDVYFGAVFSRAEHGNYTSHVSGTLAQIDQQLAQWRAKDERQGTAKVSQSRLVLVSLSDTFNAVQQNALAAGFELPATMLLALDQ